MPRTLSSLLLAVLLLSLGFLGVRFVAQNRPEPAGSQVLSLRPVGVQVRELRRALVPVRIRGYGTLLAPRVASLASEVGGPLTYVMEEWRIGAYVEEGKLLFKVDGRALLLEVERAKALVEQAQGGLEQARHEEQQARAAHVLAHEQLDTLEREEARWQGLLDSGEAAVSRVDAARKERLASALTRQNAETREERAAFEVDGAVARLRELERTLEIHELTLEKVAVRAPFAGRLASRAPALGTSLLVGIGVAELADVSTLQLSVMLPEEDLAAVRIGQKAGVLVGARPELDLVGRVAAIGVVADPKTRAVPVEIDVPNPGATGEPNGIAPLASGQFAEASIVAETLTGVLTIDRGHFKRTGSAPVAYVVSSGEGGELFAVERALELGRAIADGYVVRSGLEPGERLIVAPLRQLSHGTPVRIESERGSE